MSIGPAEIIIVLIIALLVFGPKRLPQMGRSLGRGVREFRKAADTAKTELGLDGVTDQINEVKETITGPIREVTSTFTEPLDEVKGTFTDLKQSVDVKAAIEAPVQAGAAGAVAAAAAPTQPLGEFEEGPETPAVTPQTVFADVAPPEEPAQDVDAPEEPAFAAAAPEGPDDPGAVDEPETAAVVAADAEPGA